MVTQDRVIECEQEMMKAFMSFESRSENDYDLYKELIKPVLKLSNDVGKEEENFKAALSSELVNYTIYLLKNKSVFTEDDLNFKESTYLNDLIHNVVNEYIERMSILKADK